jgi:hypothetical protein
MTTVPKKVAERISLGVKRFQPILASARARDVTEADTVTIIKDMLEGIFGYCKYSEVTSEHAIRNTFCDLAIKIDGSLQTLMEVKAIGNSLKDNHIKQAIDYAANQGVEWVALTNGIQWHVYKVHFTRPIEHELVVDIDFLALNPKKQEDLEVLYLWCKEGWAKSVVGSYYAKKQSLSRYSIGAAILGEPVLKVIRNELKKLTPDIKIELDQIKNVISNEVIKREVLEGEKATQAQSKLNRLAKKQAKEKISKNEIIASEKENPEAA